MSLAVLLTLVAVLAACGGSDEPQPDAAPTEANGGPGDAFDPAAHFEGQEIVVNVPFEPGGAYDVTARILAEFIMEYVPGVTRTSVQNLPGSGGERELRTTLTSEPDGYTLGQLHPRFIKQEMTGIDVPEFDPETVLIVGAPTVAADFDLFCVDSGVATSWSEVDEPVTVGASGPDDAAIAGPYFVELVGGPVKAIFGYGGTSEIMAGFDRGETTGTNRCNDRDTPALYPEWIEDQRLVPLFWSEAEPPAEFLESLGPWEPPVHIFDVPGTDPNEDERAAFDATLALNAFSSTIILPNDTPQEISDYWVQTYRDIVEDPEFAAAIEATGRQAAYGAPDELIGAMRVIENLTPEGRRIFEAMVGE
ncbi:MAG: hypothetical protein WD425_00525 [Nitrospirales bacterium]